MTNEEVNKVIAEFMGNKFIEGSYGGFIETDLLEGHCLYTRSISRLIPVYEKISQFSCKPNRIEIDFDETFNDFRVTVCSNDISSPYIESRCGNIHQAAAHATAKAILELQSGK